MKNIYMKLIFGFGIGLMIFLIAIPIVFSHAIKRDNNREAYIQKSEYYFKGEIIDYEQIRNSEYALLIKYDTFNLISGDLTTKLYSGVIDTLSKQIIYMAYVYPQHEYYPQKKIEYNEFPNYIKVDGKNNKIEYYRNSILYNSLDNNISTLGDYPLSDKKFKKYLKKIGIKNILYF